MRRLRRGQRVSDTKPRGGHWPGHPYFPKPDGWKPPESIRFDRLKKQYATARYSFSAAVLHIYFAENMTIRETAKILDCDVQQVKWQVEELKKWRVK